MIENRWLLFVLYFVGMLTLRFIFFRNSNTHIAEHIFTTLTAAALLAYLDKYFKRLFSFLVPKIVAKLVGPKSKQK
jgi:hypothetical protein